MRHLVLDVEHFKARLLQDALTEATAQYWIHRAHQFQQASPRRGDYHGQADRDELLDRWERCNATVLACLRHAELILEGKPEPISIEVAATLGEVT